MNIQESRISVGKTFVDLLVNVYRRRSIIWRIDQLRQAVQNQLGAG